MDFLKFLPDNPSPASMAEDWIGGGRGCVQTLVHAAKSLHLHGRGPSFGGGDQSTTESQS